VAYDTMYAMVDRDDDIPAGIKSTAILFGSYDRAIIAVLQLLCLLSLYLAGQAFALGLYFNLSLVAAAILFGYHQYLIRNRDSGPCFRAFLHNNWVGVVIFVGIVLHYGIG
jgi:4-hydroxybenzoate polyprenyltransferase